MPDSEDIDDLDAMEELMADEDDALDHESSFLGCTKDDVGPLLIKTFLMVVGSGIAHVLNKKLDERIEKRKKSAPTSNIETEIDEILEVTTTEKE